MTKREKKLIKRLSLSLIFLALFAIVVFAVSTGAAIPFDTAVSSTIQRRMSGPLTRISIIFSLSGSVAVLTALFAIAVAMFYFMHRRSSALVLALVMGGAVVLENALKYTFQRPRPAAFLTAPESFSFPSGHAVFSVCFYVAAAGFFAPKVAGRAGRAALWTCVIMLITAIGLSRIYLGIHFPTDVIGGYLIAAFWLCVVWAAEPFLPDDEKIKHDKPVT